jgi:hypothetical protein
MRKVLRGYAKERDGNPILIGTIPAPHSKDKASPSDGPQGTVPAYPKIGPRYGHCGEYFCIHLPSLSNIVVSG